MSKRSINRQQQRRIKQLHDKHIKNNQRGLVIARYGKHVTVSSSDDQIHHCSIRQNLGDLAAGDQVVWQPEKGNTGIVLAVLERTSAFGRPDKNGRIKAVAANIDQLLIVVAPQPELTTSLLDSYLVAAATLNLAALIILNKVDLISNQAESNLVTTLKTYQNIGYPVVTTSCIQADGMHALQPYLRDKSSVFVGQSGVGKSSLINKLIPDKDVRIGALSAQDKVGKHTTSYSYLYQLATGGSIIDSPGIRTLHLWQMEPRMIAQGFIEFRPYLNQCKFRNCQHLHENNCALKQAVAQGKIASARLESFHKIVGSEKSLTP